MSRPLRIQSPGLVYHVMARGNGKSAIFLDSHDYRACLDVLSEMTVRFEVECWLYCQMPNHYHLVLKTRRANLSAALHHLNGHYARYWNGRHQHVGHVFQGRYKAQIVEPAGYLQNLCRYIMLNPVRAGLARDVSAWRWSSYHALAGRVVPPSFLLCTPILSMYGAVTRKVQAQCFIAHVKHADSAERDIARLIREEAAVIGSDAFKAQFTSEAEAASREVPRRQRTLGGVTLTRLLAEAGRQPLPDLLRRAHCEHHFPITEIATRVGLTERAVRRLIVKAQVRPGPDGQSSDLAPTGGE